MRMRLRMLGVAAMRRVASRPSSFGIWMSISTTSGCSRRVDRDRLLAVAGLADDLDVVLGLEDQPEAGSHQRLVVGEDDAGRHVARRRSAGRSRARRSRLRACARRAGGRRGGRPARACRSARGRRHAAPVRHPRRRPSSQHLDLERRRLCSARRTRGGRPAGVLEGVGQRLLDHPVGGHLERARQRPRLALDRQLDRQPSLPGLRDQLGELGEVRLRRELVGLVRRGGGSRAAGAARRPLGGSRPRSSSAPPRLSRAGAPSPAAPRRPGRPSR